VTRAGCLKKGGSEDGKTEAEGLRDKQVPESEGVGRVKDGVETEEKKHVSFRDKPSTLQPQRAGCFMKGGTEDGKMEAEGLRDKQVPESAGVGRGEGKTKANEKECGLLGRQTSPPLPAV